MTEIDENYTEYAPAEREDIDIVRYKFLELSKISLIRTLTDAIPDIFLILNDKRQIVYANIRLLEIFGLNSIDQVLGKRPGEILNCKYSSIYPGGCGTTLFCSQCAAVNSILESLKGISSVQECRILDINNKGYDFLVWATPFEYQGNKYSIFTLRDISDQKRREALEKIFFHDILNTLNGLLGFAKIVQENPNTIFELKHIFLEIATTLLDEVNAQKILLEAEQGKLKLSLVQINSIEFLTIMKNLYQNHIVAEGKEIVVDSNSANFTFETDRTLLQRSFGNLIKNALEAINQSEIVTIGATKKDEEIVLWVHNPGLIPWENQLQIFQRSFSTKGAGRGLGTYSAKLLCENYLKGKVDFTSTEPEGTTFFIRLKIHP